MSSMEKVSLQRQTEANILPENNDNNTRTSSPGLIGGVNLSSDHSSRHTDECLKIDANNEGQIIEEGKDVVASMKLDIFRPPSDLLVDLHVYVVPVNHWCASRRLASMKILSHTVSAGFIRVLPQHSVASLRKEITSQLGSELVPKDYVFVKAVGENFTELRMKQEQDLKAKHFLPPLSTEPAIFIMEIPIYEAYFARQHQRIILNHSHLCKTEALASVYKRNIAKKSLKDRFTDDSGLADASWDSSVNGEILSDVKQSFDNFHKRQEDKIHDERKTESKDFSRLQLMHQNFTVPHENLQKNGRFTKKNNKAKYKKTPKPVLPSFKLNESRTEKMKEGKINNVSESEKNSEIEMKMTSRGQLLLKMMVTFQKERLEEEFLHDDLVKQCRDLQDAIVKRQEQLLEEWKVKFLSSKKRTNSLEDKSRKAKDILEDLHRTFLEKLTKQREISMSRYGTIKPSEKITMKYLCLMLQQEISEVKKRIDLVKMQLDTECKLTEEVEKENSRLRQELQEFNVPRISKEN